MSGYKPKYKDQHTVFLKNNMKLTDLMKIISVCGEVGYFAIRLFGVYKNSGSPRYGDIRKQMLEECEYKDSEGKVIFRGKAFSLRGKGREKTIRVTSGGQRLFEEFDWGKEYIEKFTGRSLPTDRERVLRTVSLSEWCIFLLRSGIEFNPQVNPELFLSSHLTSESNTQWVKHSIDSPIFYPSKEIKRTMPGHSSRGRGSRAQGFLVKKDKVEICYTLPKTRMVWFESEEGVMNTFATTKFGPVNFEVPWDFKHPDALCLVDDYDKCEQVVFEPPYNNRFVSPKVYKGGDKKLFKDMFSNVYVFPRNEGGIKSFIFHNIPYIDDLVFKFYIAEESYRKDTYRSGYDCDAYNYNNKIATLFFFDGNITKLHRCAEVRKRHSEAGVNLETQIRVFCFPWQKKYIEKVFEGCKGVDIKTQNYDKIVEILTEKSK